MRYLISYYFNGHIDRDVIGYDSSIKSMAEIDMFEKMIKYRNDHIPVDTPIYIMMYEELC